METAKERAEKFTSELKDFLKKWNTEIELEDIGRNWASDYVMTCYLDAVYEDNEPIKEFTKVELGRYVCPD